MNIYRGIAHRASQLMKRLDDGGPLPSSHASRNYENGNAAAIPLPQQLTWRARGLLLRGRDLLDHLRTIESIVQSLDEAAPASVAYRKAVAMTELALRTMPSFPDGEARQLELCDGLENLFDEIESQVSVLQAWAQRRQAEEQRIDALADWLAGLVNGRPVIWKPIEDLAEAIRGEVDDWTPLRFHDCSPQQPDRWAAVHGLGVANVIARLVRTRSEWRQRPLEPIKAALVFDSGVAGIPANILNQPKPLNAEDRRQIEAHVGMGAESLKRLLPSEGWLADVVLAHHERLDGTGYPAGLTGSQIPRLARLLAVADVYAALSAPRPWRPAFSPRAALTETLMEADRGRLDPELAEWLLELSFYPVGTVVEMADGQIAIVVATNRGPDNLPLPSRPVVQLLMDANNKPLPWATTVNLAQSDGIHIVRSLTKEESQSLLGPRFWPVLT